MRVKKTHWHPAPFPTNLSNELPTSIRTIAMSREKYAVVRGCLRSALSDEWEPLLLDFRGDGLRWGMDNGVITDRSWMEDHRSGSQVYVRWIFFKCKTIFRILLLEQGPCFKNPFARTTAKHNAKPYAQARVFMFWRFVQQLLKSSFSHVNELRGPCGSSKSCK